MIFWISLINVSLVWVIFKCYHQNFVGHGGLIVLKTGSLVILPGFLGQSCHLSTDLTVGGSPSQRLEFWRFLIGNHILLDSDGEFSLIITSGGFVANAIQRVNSGEPPIKSAGGWRQMESVSESKVVGMERGEDIGKSRVIFETRISSELGDCISSYRFGRFLRNEALWQFKRELI